MESGLEKAIKQRTEDYLATYEKNETDGTIVIRNGNNVTIHFKNNEAGKKALEMYKELQKPIKRRG
jgi:hypothetical protein